jgi:hypothetical protein
MLTYLGKILVRYLMQITPPMDLKSNPFGENVWAAQKKVGEASIRADFAKAYRPLRVSDLKRLSAKAHPRVLKYLRKYFTNKNTSAINTIFRSLGISPNQIQVIDSLSLEFAKRNTDFTRRPHGFRRRFFYVSKAATINSVIKEAISHLGRAKAGWLAAAGRLGFKGAPVWVKKHAGFVSGTCEDRRKDRTVPSFTLINSTHGASGHDVDVVGSAMRELTRSGVNLQLQKMLAKRVRTFNAGQRAERSSNAQLAAA